MRTPLDLGTLLSTDDCPTTEDEKAAMMNVPYCKLNGALTWIAIVSHRYRVRNHLSRTVQCQPRSDTLEGSEACPAVPERHETALSDVRTPIW